jgi:hypothetical protein
MYNPMKYKQNKLLLIGLFCFILLLIIGGCSVFYILKIYPSNEYGKALTGIEWYFDKCLDLENEYLKKPENNVSKLSPGGDLNIPRQYHSATLLKDGQVLIIGGFGNHTGNPISAKAYKTVELYNPSQNKFQLLKNETNYAHGYGHQTILLDNGQVLIIDHNGAEIFDPVTQRFVIVGPIQVPRMKSALVLRTDGKVVIIGGFTPSESLQDNSKQYVSVVEIYDPVLQKFQSQKIASKFNFDSDDILVNGISRNNTVIYFIKQDIINKPIIAYNYATGDYKSSIVRFNHLDEKNVSIDIKINKGILLNDNNVLLLYETTIRDWATWSDPIAYIMSIGGF